MSEQSPPPPPAAKPKPGSLRDRIAAFEKSATSSNAPHPPPAPRPKPAGFATWKPKPPSPPSSPSPSASSSANNNTSGTANDDEHTAASGLSTAAGARSVGTMSASDAKESITKGGSLKERMAALQGKGAFGAPAPASGPPPRPAGDKPKPKWKPPPPAAPATSEGGDQTKTTGTADIAAAVQRTLSPPISTISSAAGKSEQGEGDGDAGGEDTPKPKRAISTEGEEGAATETNENDGAAAAAAEAEGEPDPEEEERQRRAAIAARMARLGGARVGMAPPVFGMKPPVRKPTQESVEVEAPAKKSMEEGEVKPADIPLPTSPEPLKPVEESPSFGLPTSPPLEGQPQSQSESESVKSPVQLPTRKDSTNISILSTDSDTGVAEPHAPKQPTSMPVPAVPRRAGPPRKKPAKPTASPPAAPTQPEEKTEEKEEAVEGPKPLVTNTELPDTQIPAPEAEPVSLVIAAAEEAEKEKEKEKEKEREQDEIRLDEATPRPGPPHVDEKGKDEEKQGAAASVDEEPEEKAEDEPAAVKVAGDIREEEKPSPYNPPSSSITSPSLSSILSEEILQSPPPSLAMSPSQTMTAPVQRGVSVGSLEMAIEKKIGDEVGDDRIEEDEAEAEAGVPKLPAVNSGEEFGVDLDQVELDDEQQGLEGKDADADDVQIVMESVTPRPEPERAQEGKGLVNSEGADIDEEEEEAARKKRVAERIAKMGGVNPFALPPPSVRSPPLAAAKSPSPSSGGLAPVESATLEDQDDVYARALETSGPGAEDTKATTASVGSSEKEDEDDEKEKLGALGADEADQFDEDEDEDEDEDDVRGSAAAGDSKMGSTSGVPPPLPPTRPPVHGQQYHQEVAEEKEEEDLAYDVEEEEEEDEKSDYGDESGVAGAANSGVAASSEQEERMSPSPSPSPPPPPPPRPAQPPRRIIPQTPQRAQSDAEDEDGDEDRAVPIRSGQKQSMEEQEAYDSEGTDEEADERMATSHLFVPPPSGRGPIVIAQSQNPGYGDADSDGDGSENDSPALPVPPTRRSVEGPIAGGLGAGGSAGAGAGSRKEDEEDGNSEEDESDHDGRALPIRPLGGHSRLSGSGFGAMSSSSSSSPPPPAPPSRPPPSNPIPVPAGSSASSERLTPSVSVSGSEEILDEEEGDPIDPSFHSPSRQASFANLRSAAEQSDVTPPVQNERPSVVQRSPPAPAKQQQPREEEETDEKEEEEDQEQLRRKTIAERMAKLGGIRFGAAPPLHAPSRPPPAPRREEEDEEERGEASSAAPATTTDEGGEVQPVLSEEEEERARKERIAAKMAQMGGMRIGMMPMGMGMGLHGAGAQRTSHVLREAEPRSPPATSASPPPPARAVPPPARPPPPPTAAAAPSRAPPVPAPAQAQDTDGSEYAMSEDGIKVEAEESEMEEVGYEDVGSEQEEEEEEEAPPPIPSRTGRGAHRQDSSDRTVSSPPLPPSRPPVPVPSMPIRRSSVQTTKSTGGSSVHTTSASTRPAQPERKSTEYVMVDEPEDIPPPPPPPARPVSRAVPPSRSAPQIPPAPPTRTKTADSTTDISSQWELPSIPTSSLDMDGSGSGSGAAGDLAMSWTDAGVESTSSSAAAAATLSIPAAAAPAAANRASVLLPMEKQLSSDDLMMLWGRVGVQVCEVATALYEKSKKTVVGDGSYAGFVRAVLSSVPNAAPAPTSSNDAYGYLIYHQTGPTVHKRLSDIMPGDIVCIVDAKLKGHKGLGLQTYHQTVAPAGSEPLVGVVGEFEPKKTKVRVFHASVHVGGQSVDSVSYRLEDVRSGDVKVYRVRDMEN